MYLAGIFIGIYEIYCPTIYNIFPLRHTHFFSFILSSCLLQYNFLTSINYPSLQRQDLLIN